jgi:hypothetical protein
MGIQTRRSDWYSRAAPITERRRLRVRGRCLRNQARSTLFIEEKKMSKPTTGPWSYSMYEDSNHAKIYLHGLGGQDAVKGGDSLQGYCGEANARLIAAAPDLLEALQEVMSWIYNWDPDFTFDNEWAGTEIKARAAIKKAMGEE